MMQTTNLADRLRIVCDADMSGALEGSGVSVCAAKMVLMALLRYTDARGVCWPSQSRVARDAGVHRARVKRAYRALERIGVIGDATPEGRTTRSRCVRVDFDALRALTGSAAQQETVRSATHDDALRTTNTPENDSKERHQEHRVARDAGPVGDPLSGEGEPEGHDETPGVRAMLELGAEARAVRALLHTRGDEAMLDAVRLAREKGASLRNPAAFAVKACREGWKSAGAASRERVEREERARARRAQERHAEEERLREEQRETMARNEEARERVVAMADDERTRLWEAFVRERCSTQGDLVMRVYAQRDPREYPVVARLFTTWIDGREQP